MCGLKTAAEMDEDIPNVFLETGTRLVADISRMESGKESFYLIVSEKPAKGKTFCEDFKHQNACIDDFCEKPVTGKLAKSKLLMSEKPVKGSGLLTSEKHAKSSGKPVKDSGLFIAKSLWLASL